MKVARSDQCPRMTTQVTVRSPAGGKESRRGGGEAEVVSAEAQK